MTAAARAPDARWSGAGVDGAGCGSPRRQTLGALTGSVGYAATPAVIAAGGPHGAIADAQPARGPLQVVSGLRSAPAPAGCADLRFDLRRERLEVAASTGRVPRSRQRLASAGTTFSATP